MKIAVIGGGNMGSAIVRGLVAGGKFSAADISVSSPRQSTLDTLSAYCPGIIVSTDNRSVIKGADYIILAVKPWILPTVLDEIAPAIAFRRTSPGIACGRNLYFRYRRHAAPIFFRPFNIPSRPQYRDVGRGKHDFHMP